MRALAVRAAAEVLGAARTSLMLVDDSVAELKVVAAVGNKLAPAEMDSVAVGAGVAGLAHARSEALLVADVGAATRASPSASPRAAMRRSSFAVAPLIAGARTLGVLCATERSGGHAFDAEDLALLRIIAGQVAHMLQAPPVAAIRNPSSASIWRSTARARHCSRPTRRSPWRSPRRPRPQPSIRAAQTSRARSATPSPPRSSPRACSTPRFGRSPPRSRPRPSRSTCATPRRASSHARPSTMQAGGAAIAHSSRRRAG